MAVMLVNGKFYKTFIGPLRTYITADIVSKEFSISDIIFHGSVIKRSLDRVIYAAEVSDSIFEMLDFSLSQVTQDFCNVRMSENPMTV